MSDDVAGHAAPARRLTAAATAATAAASRTSGAIGAGMAR